MRKGLAVQLKAPEIPADVKLLMASGNAAPAMPASRQTNQPETATVRYRTVQIGANSQFGGDRHRSFDEPLVPAARSGHRAGNGREQARGHEREQGKEGRKAAPQRTCIDHPCKHAPGQSDNLSDKTLPSDLICSPEHHRQCASALSP